MLLLPATLILPTMFCFSITPLKYHYTLSYFTPLSIGLAGVVSFFARRPLISSEIKSFIICYVIFGLISFLFFSLARNIKYNSFLDKINLQKPSSEMNRNISRFALFLCGFLFSGGFTFTLYFSATYLSEVHIINLPAKLSPLNLHCYMLIILLPIAGYLHARFGLLKIMYLAAIGFVVQAIIFSSNPEVTPFLYMTFRSIFAISCFLMLAPLCWVIYHLSTMIGRPYSPLLWTIGGFSFALIVRYLLPLQNTSPYCAKALMLLACLFTFILLVPKIKAFSGIKNKGADT